MSNSRLRPETIAAHALKSIDEATGAVAPPLYPSSTYARDENYHAETARKLHPQRQSDLWHAEDAIAALEQGRGCLLFASGMAAITTLLETVPQGAHVVAPDVMYYGTRDWLKRLESAGRIALTLVRSATKPGRLAAQFADRQDRSRVDRDAAQSDLGCDRHRGGGQGRACGGRDPRRRCDGDSAAVTTQPLTLGADIVFHSATKYLNGHSDVLAGALVTGEANARWNEIATLRTKIGTPLAPFECWLLTRGLAHRFSCATARLRPMPWRSPGISSGIRRIERVLYPGLASHRGHAIAATADDRRFRRHAVAAGQGQSRRCAASSARWLKVIVPATSLGGVESLAEHRKTVEGPESPVPDNLVRLSIGIEHADDLIADIEQALAKV